MAFKWPQKSSKWWHQAGVVVNIIYSATSIVILVIAIFTLEENKNQFAISNEPYIYIYGNVGLSNWDSVTKHPIITYTILDIVKTPVEIDSAIYGIRYDIFAPKDIFNESDTNIIIDRTHATLIQEYPHNAKFDGLEINTKGTIDSLKKRVNTFFGVIFFTNHINNKRRYFIFSIRLAPYMPSGPQPVDQWYTADNENKLPRYKNKIFRKFIGWK